MDSLKEVWKDITGYENMYQVSSLGRVKSLTRNTGNQFRQEHIRKTHKNKYGYEILSIQKERKLKTITVHRLVAIAF